MVGRARRAKLAVNRDNLQAIFGFKLSADGTAVAMPCADLKIPPESPNFRLFRHYPYELEMHA